MVDGEIKMKIKDLIKELEKFDQDYEVYLCVTDPLDDYFLYKEVCSSAIEGFVDSKGSVCDTETYFECYEPEEREDMSNKVVILC